MKITIWGELATTIEDGMLDSNQNVAVVIIITGTFVKERMGFISISTTQASRIFVNLDNEQVQEFRMRLGKETEEIEEIHLEQEKDPFEDKITLYEASQMLLDYENKNKEFFCEASIVRFNEGKGWYYIACKKCKKQVQNNDGKISCPKCIKTFDGKVLPWYWITVRIKDNTVYADLTIFGFNVEKMLKYTAAEHVDYAERCEKLEEPDKATQVFDKLIGEKFGFKLKITEENIQKQSDDYTVLKVHTIVKKKKTASDQLGPKTPQKEKQQKIMLLENEKHQKRNKLRRMVDSEDDKDEKEDETLNMNRLDEELLYGARGVLLFILFFEKRYLACFYSENLEDKVVVITGSSSGIGELPNEI
ncbi:uncharacterized protein LOC113296560 [Papaver somniferum]|uniref:uncharacterized protein LOC113296560 n=1 Tax=Papaver somniferum TaxID=3469 RepID=UPI000E702F0F|nr:uncharacterized protein LOC113296560 [Papaver somniferum]